MNGYPPLRPQPIRRPWRAGWDWTRRGFDIFNLGMGASVLMLLLWLGVGLVLEQLPAGSLISQLLYMVWGAGWAAVAARGYGGATLQFSDFLAGFRHRLTPLILGGLFGLSLLTGIALLCVGLVYKSGLIELLQQDPATLTVGAAQIQQLLLALLLGLVLVLPVVMAMMFAPVLIYFHGVGVMQAARLSFQGCVRNAWPLCWWGLVGLLFILLGTALLLVGLLVVLPALQYSLYAAYRDIFLDEQVATEPLANPSGFEA
ncbi:BPSS1780 family membrane protein [Aeromonas cavernicola]|uniref:DUF975 domain-containing protein n=1 Tax=Aeromonas cavernicola TaxID=1006623 RepID=A0A2H9U5G1_9GAMM|nr:BPSS1780 family membrane protein [Aeromonas cavernicola]PJG59285.1 hypothetical protein CUC53_08265 [Aeromonas cavernicola]